MTLLTGLTSGACEADSVLSVDGFPMGEDGIEKGVSACYAGRIGDCIVMAGGCNFPVNTLAPDSKKKSARQTGCGGHGSASCRTHRLMA